MAWLLWNKTVISSVGLGFKVTQQNRSHPFPKAEIHIIYVTKSYFYQYANSSFFKSKRKQDIVLGRTREVFLVSKEFDFLFLSISVTVCSSFILIFAFNLFIYVGDIERQVGAKRIVPDQIPQNNRLCHKCCCRNHTEQSEQ